MENAGSFTFVFLPRKTRKDTKKLRVGPNAIRADRSELETDSVVCEQEKSLISLYAVENRIRKAK
mgnify:CR=1 FL=1